MRAHTQLAISRSNKTHKATYHISSQFLSHAPSEAQHAVLSNRSPPSPTTTESISHVCLVRNRVQQTNSETCATGEAVDPDPDRGGGRAEPGEAEGELVG